ncbi:glutathione S-transferase family protein [Marinomonas mediterranea]|jgi:Glutathione S-transferase|uniref:glutathione transferase n=1 Tax=Marinomonas mediterranea (strain ATCC 700492 / JCM 21426 / NBRC 103028 / MMB-1) TaxID=717774 RepID=F2K353_MARM1|nr:glutathione S-transferase [Marinomonas mediterranea]ADZ90106.1 Glutathione S-transferase domain [Marinomonas mediterranea MMB-1]WCN08173.1 glutathione S-transferase [Marinomonas mediterranea]WCN12240.1 glutathione S-transferase [Marinomonas mediterranea]WCN16313.1 glutathione S-transferase [Marinomonas mediterranea MMB-1]
MITLHHLENSRSQRIAWALESLGLEYEIKRYKRDSSSAAPESLKKVHALGKAPVLDDDGIVIAESGAILEYLCDRYDDEKRLRPVSAEDMLSYRYWMHFSEGSLMPLLVMTLIFSKVPKQPMPFFVRPIAKGLCGKIQENFVNPRLQPMIELVEDTLSQQTWLAGERMTTADIQMSFPVQALARAVEVDKFPNIQRFLNQVEDNEFYIKAKERVGAFGPLAS